MFEQKLEARLVPRLFFNWHRADMFGVFARQRDNQLVQVLSRWQNHEESHSMFAPTPNVFGYYSFLSFLTVWHELLFSIAVSEHCVYAFMLFFRVALIGASRYHSSSRRCYGSCRIRCTSSYTTTCPCIRG